VHSLFANNEPRSGNVAETTLTDRILAVFRDVLGQPGIGPADDYFDLGGDSLNALRIVGRLRRDLGVQVGITDLAAQPTAAGLAAVVEQRLAQAGNGGGS
jgi:acyl carrier protein